MKKNAIIKVLVALVVCAAAIFGIKTITAPKVVEGSKEITITLENQGEKIGTVTTRTDAELLSELLIELQTKKEIQFQYSDSAYGMYITGLGIQELVEEDAEKQLYWTYTSDNNKACLATGYGCDAASAVAIEDGDAFVFSLSKF
ncbi:MAG: hypothetical protein Q4C49_12925 [Bacillota bacterium]|nr:hypothetical protein [Bacillota bacterium]